MARPAFNVLVTQNGIHPGRARSIFTGIVEQKAEQAVGSENGHVQDAGILQISEQPALMNGPYYKEWGEERCCCCENAGAGNESSSIEKNIVHPLRAYITGSHPNKEQDRVNPRGNRLEFFHW